MKRNLSRTTLGIVFFAALVSLAPAAQANGCTMSDVAGKWGYTCTGTIIVTAGAIPAAAVGRFALDAIGNISGTQIRNVGGSVAAETIKGTGTVNADCTATYKVDVYDGGKPAPHGGLGRRICR